jgi:hypothetical protein
MHYPLPNDEHLTVMCFFDQAHASMPEFCERLLATASLPDWKKTLAELK